MQETNEFIPSDMPLKIGLLGGTFNPIHNAHIRMAQKATKKYHLDKCFFMVAAVTPDKQEAAIVSASDRFNMAVLAASLDSSGKITASDFEIKKGGISYTFQTLEQLCEMYKNASFTFIVGADRLYNIENWKYPERIFKVASLLAIPRVGANDLNGLISVAKSLNEKYGVSITVADFSVPNVSSSEIRANIKNAKPISDYVPYQCERYLYENMLYQPDYIRRIAADLKERLSLKRYTHAVSAMRSAIFLAEKYSADAEKCRLAALLHDSEKVGGANYIALAKEVGITPDEYELELPGLLHPALGAVMVKKRYGITDPEICSAIACHTLCRPKMTDVDKITFLADKIEALRDFPGVEGLRVAATRGLNEGVLACMDFTINSLKSQGKKIHPAMITAYKYIIDNE